MTYYTATITNSKFNALGRHPETEHEMRLPLEVKVLFTPVLPRKLPTIERRFAADDKSYLTVQISNQLRELEAKAELHLFLKQETSERDLPFDEFCKSDGKPLPTQDTPADWPQSDMPAGEAWEQPGEQEQLADTEVSPA